MVVKRQLLIGGAIAAAALAGGLYYFVLRDARSPCQRYVGDLAELEKLTGKQLTPQYSYAGKYHCSETIGFRSGDRNTTVVSIEVTDARDLTSTRARYERDAFVKTIPLAISSTAVLFVAGTDVVQPSPDQLLSEARRHVGQGSRDGIGDALAALPPSKHVALFAIGDRMTKISLLSLIHI